MIYKTNSFYLKSKTYPAIAKMSEYYNYYMINMYLLD